MARDDLVELAELARDLKAALEWERLAGALALPASAPSARRAEAQPSGGALVPEAAGSGTMAQGRPGGAARSPTSTGPTPHPPVRHAPPAPASQRAPM